MSAGGRDQQVCPAWIWVLSRWLTSCSRATPSATGRSGSCCAATSDRVWPAVTVAVPCDDRLGGAGTGRQDDGQRSAPRRATTTVTASRPRRFRRRWAGRTSRPVGTSRSRGRAARPPEVRSQATAAPMESSISRPRDRPCAEHVSDRTCVRFLARHPKKVETRVEQVFETPARAAYLCLMPFSQAATTDKGSVRTSSGPTTAWVASTVASTVAGTAALPSGARAEERQHG